jgi:hypothetical protein
MSRQLLIGTLVVAAVAGTASSVHAASRFILNEANSVNGDEFIDKGRSDPFFATATGGFGRLEGHGQNWFEFLVVEGDELPGGGYGNTLDLRGWTVDWEYNKVDLDVGESPQFGSGTMTFTNDPLWAAVPKGTLLTVSEWQKVWYDTQTSPLFDPWGAGGLERKGGINGFGLQPNNNDYVDDPAVHRLLDLSTDTTWNPRDTSAIAGSDWHMHVWAGERNLDDSFRYFEFAGSVTDDGETYQIGVDDDAGLFAINNDGWQWTITGPGGDSQGPFGEDESADGGGNWGANPTEIIKLEAFNVGTSPTEATYMNVNVNHYRDGSTGSFSGSNSWSSGGGFQDLAALRDWLVDGDADLDGIVDGSDFLAWQRNVATDEDADRRQGDLTGDGAVDELDLAEWELQLGAVAPAGSAVPEPQAWALAALAAVALSRRRLNH